MNIILSTKLKPTAVKSDCNLVSKSDLSFNNPVDYHSRYEQTNNLVKGETENHFLNTFITAYNNHVPLKLRPDDIHIALQLIFCTCINNNAEKLRNVFVDFDGQKELIIQLKSFDPDVMMRLFTDEIKNNIKNFEFSEKFVTDYSTTTPIIKTVSNTLLMNATKEYFKFTCIMSCGIPEVILDGTTNDWKKLQDYYKYMKTLLCETELKKWFIHFDVIMNMFVDMVAVSQYEPSENCLSCIFDRRSKHISDKQKYISKLWERVISYVPQGSGGDTFLGGWVRLFFPYFDNELIDGMDWLVLPCLDINSEPTLMKNTCYGNQNVLKKFYAASSWCNISHACTTTPLKIIDFDGLEYESEIFSGFFEHYVSETNIVSMNIGIVVREDIAKRNNKNKQKYLDMGCLIEKYCISVPRILFKFKAEIIEAFNGRRISYYESEKCKDEQQKYLDDGVLKRYTILDVPQKYADDKSYLMTLFDTCKINIIENI